MKDYQEGILDAASKALLIDKEWFVFVWFAKTLQNAKAILATELYDGLGFYEITYNGDKDEYYVVSYREEVNTKVKL